MDRGKISNREERMQRALDCYRAAQARGPDSLVVKKVEDLRYYDVPAMENIVAVCNLGRSGSLLLASFLDRHRDVVMLATLRSQRIYQFFQLYPSLSLREKLVTFPIFAEEYGQPFFYGDFPIPEGDYYAAIDALFEVYGSRSSASPTSRRTFVQFVHAAYSISLGRRPATRSPLMVYAQHGFDTAAAAQLVEDFPGARFIHTIRNPIAGFDSWFDLTVYKSVGAGELPYPGYLGLATSVFGTLLPAGQPLPGMAERTRAVRFEDMHLNTEGTLRSLTRWLEISEIPSTCESTFNGIPYIAGNSGADWTGARPEQAQRRLRNTSGADQAFLFALLYEHFVAWGYPCPRVFRYAWIRRPITKMLLIVPMKMEIATARLTLSHQMRPALRQGKYGFAVRVLLRLLTCHWYLWRLVSAELKCRINSMWGAVEWPGGKVPGHFEVLRPIRPGAVDDVTKATSAAPASDADENPDVLAQVLIAEFSDANFVHDGIGNDTRGRSEIPPATIARRIAGAATLLAPIVQGIRDQVFRAGKIHALDMPVTLESPATDRRISGRAWIYVRDDRAFSSADAAVAFFYTPKRRPEDRAAHLHGFQGFLQADVFPGFEGLYDPARPSPGPIIEVACWSRYRSRYTDIWEATGSEVAWEALDRIAAIFAIETEARFKPEAVRMQIRSAARPLVLSFFAWAESSLDKLHDRSPLAVTFRDALERRPALMRFLDHGCLEIDNRCAENAVRGIRSGGRGWTIGDIDAGEHAAAICSIIGSAVLNDLNLPAYLRNVLRRLIERSPTDRTDPLLPWNWKRFSEGN